MSLLYILGRQSSIGLAELESLYGSQAITNLNGAALVDHTSPISFERLGGSVKCAEVLHTISGYEQKKLQYAITQSLLEVATQQAEGKFTFGLSFHNIDATIQKITAMGLSAKKELKQTGRSIRLTANKETSLSSAQVFHNQLTKTGNCELIIYKHDQKVIIARTTNVQDIDAYTLRDRGRPKRDARVGMLPPKLAQIIINLAKPVTTSVDFREGSVFPTERGDTNWTLEPSEPERRLSEVTILDPFCGTGVLLNEALLQGNSVYGTDLEQRMIDYSEQNIEWLRQKYPSITASSLLEQGDATSFTWQQPIDTIACETYLGRPFTTPPNQDLLQKNQNDCDIIHRKFLKNLALQTTTGFRACIAVPAWFVDNRVYHLKTLDYLEEIGYNRMSFVHASQKELIYHREGQFVGRELVVITRK